MDYIDYELQKFYANEKQIEEMQNAGFKDWQEYNEYKANNLQQNY